MLVCLLRERNEGSGEHCQGVLAYKRYLPQRCIAGFAPDDRLRIANRTAGEVLVVREGDIVVRFEVPTNEAEGWGLYPLPHQLTDSGGYRVVTLQCRRRRGGQPELGIQTWIAVDMDVPWSGTWRASITISPCTPSTKVCICCSMLEEDGTVMCDRMQLSMSRAR